MISSNGLSVYYLVSGEAGGRREERGQTHMKEKCC